MSEPTRWIRQQEEINENLSKLLKHMVKKIEENKAEIEILKNL